MTVRRRRHCGVLWMRPNRPGAGKRKRKTEKTDEKKEDEKDPAKDAEFQKKVEEAAALRIKSTRLLPVWGLRFTPAETGQYTLQIYIRNSAGETRSDERKLTVLPEQNDPAKPGCWGGNVRVSKRDPQQFELANGDPFFIYGAECLLDTGLDAVP